MKKVAHWAEKQAQPGIREREREKERMREKLGRGVGPRLGRLGSRTRGRERVAGGERLGTDNCATKHTRPRRPVGEEGVGGLQLDSGSCWLGGPCHTRAMLISSSSFFLSLGLELGLQALHMLEV